MDGLTDYFLIFTYGEILNWHFLIGWFAGQWELMRLRQTTRIIMRCPRSG